MSKYYIPVEMTPEKIKIAYEAAKRNYEIALRAYNGDSYETIGNDYGISKQRVAEILKKLYIGGSMRNDVPNAESPK